MPPSELPRFIGAGLSFRSLRLAPSREALGPALRIELDLNIGRITR